MRKCFGLVFIISSVLAACLSSQNNLTPPIRVTTLPSKTNSPTPTITPTWTPPPKLSPEEASQLLLELYETNGGCEMPCWWGIVPGETSWETALELLLPLGWVSDNPSRYKKFFVYRFVVDVPEVFEPFSLFTVYLDTQDHIIVQGFSVDDTYVKPYNDYTLSDYLVLLGGPDQIYVEIHFNLVYFSLIYLEKGLILYNQQIENELWEATKFFACPQHPGTWHWNVWNPKTVLMEDLVDAVVDWQNEFPLEEVSGVTPEEFYEIYLDPNTTVCIEGQGGAEP